MRFLARLRHAPLALLGLLQAVGTEWKSMLFSDLVELHQLVAPSRDRLPLPHMIQNNGLILRHSTLCSGSNYYGGFVK